MEIGSLAEWVTGAITSIGIILSLRSGKIRVKGSHEISNNNVYLSFENKSNFSIKIKHGYITFYNDRFAREAIHKNYFGLNESSNKKYIELDTRQRTSHEVKIKPNNFPENKDYYIAYGCDYTNKFNSMWPFRKKITFEDPEVFKKRQENDQWKQLELTLKAMKNRYNK